MILEIQKLKRLLGIESTDCSQDIHLEFVLGDVEEMVLNYCNLSQIPKGLINTVYRMAMDLYRSESIGEAEGPTGGITSIKEGDTTVTFSQNENQFKDSLLKNYTAQLNHYRKLAW